MALLRRALQLSAVVGAALTVLLTGATTHVLGQAAPTSPPTRFFGNITGAQTGAVVKAMNGATTCGTASGNGLFNSNSTFPNIYFVDVDTTQPGCGSGTTLTFTVNGQNAGPTATVPDLPGQAVRVDLTVGGGTTTSGSGAVTYAAGWNLVGVPSGTVLGQAANPLYTFGPGATDYSQLSNTTPLAGGTGYWAYFSAPATVTLAGGSAPATVNNPGGQYVMVGNPVAGRSVTVSGADIVYAYNPAAPAGSNPYTATTTLAPGQGAWAYCANACAITQR